MGFIVKKIKITSNEELFNEAKRLGVKVCNLGSIVMYDSEITREQFSDWIKDIEKIIEDLTIFCEGVMGTMEEIK